MTAVFVLGIALGVLVGWALACIACGKIVPIWDALNPFDCRDHNGGSVSG